MHMPSLCQIDPSHLNVNRSFQKRGWTDDQETDSIPGYQRYGRNWFAVLTEANRLTDRHFQWLVNINANTAWSVDEIKKKKAQLMKNLGRPETAGLSVFWRLQINNENRDRVHFHFLVLDGFTDDKETLLEVFRKAAKPLGVNSLRFHAEPVNLEHGYLAYVLKCRPKDKNKIVLWEKGLPRFTKAGLIRFPWPKDWDGLPAVSANHKGGMARRFRKRRSRVAREEIDTVSYWVTPEYRQHLQNLTGKSAYEIRQAVLQDKEFWDQQCESWYSQRPPDTRLQERLAKIDAELKEFLRNREVKRNGGHHLSSSTKPPAPPRKPTVEQPRRQHRSVPIQPQEAQHGPERCKTSSVHGRTKEAHRQKRYQHCGAIIKPQDARRGRECNETMPVPGLFAEHLFATDVRPPIGCSP
jgi:hypothetical protein